MAMRTKGWLLAGAGAAAFGLTALTADSASAAFVERTGSSGEGCNTGTFNGCSINLEDSGGNVLGSTPALIKIEIDEGGFDEDGNLVGFEVNINENVTEYDLSTLASRIFITGTQLESEGGGFEAKAGTWTYNPIAGDPFFNAFSTKTGGGGNAPGSAESALIYSWVGSGEGSTPGVTYDWKTIDNKGLSSIVFANTGVVPLPAAAWMMIGGLGMIGGAVARSHRKARANA